jgi:hypothetical protein
VANIIGGRQLIINTTGLINLPCNFKVVDGWWQDITAAGQTFSFTDAAGRAFSFTSWSAGGTGFPTVPIGKLDWLSGPITVTAIGSGNVYLILGSK